MSLSNLISNLTNIHLQTQEHAGRQVNQLFTLRNWLFGYYLAETQLEGERGSYGDETLKNIAAQLKAKGIKGMSQSALYRFMQFYTTYPHIFPTLSQKFQTLDIETDSIFATLSQKLVEADQTVNPELLIERLNYSHFVELITVTDPLQRQFYEISAIKENMSVRQLKRAITTLTFERTALPEKQKLLPQLAQLPLKPTTKKDQLFKNPLILEFLDIQPKDDFSESDLEQAIINHLQSFLVELGRGFCFEARQKRITFDNHHYYIDLVFYHRILKCHVLIDLKIGEFTHADAGQMNLYLNYFNENEREPDDNPPVGIVLCAAKNDALVHYATGGMSQELFVHKYMLQLPSIEALKALIQEETERLKQP